MQAAGAAFDPHGASKLHGMSLLLQIVQDFLAAPVSSAGKPTGRETRATSPFDVGLVLLFSFDLVSFGEQVLSNLFEHDPVSDVATLPT